MALLLAGCVAGPSLGSAGIVIGTALPVKALDPAADMGAGGELVAEQIYPHLLTTKPGTDRLVPDIASSAAFDAQGAYVVTIKPGLRFANGDALDASDVVGSFTRQTAIRAPGGPSPLLAGIASVAARGARTVVFTLRTPGDQRFPAILASPAGAIVDQRVFPPHALADDHDIVAARPFAGPYTLQSDDPGDLLTFRADPSYAGALGAPRSADITLKLYADADNVAADVADRAIDLGYGGLEPQQLRTLRDDPGVDIVSKPGGSERYLAFDLDAMPYGAARSDADPHKAQAVRRAVADLVDRAAMAKPDDGATAPLWGFIPDGLAGAAPVLRTLTGNGHGLPSPSEAQRVLDAADVATPVRIDIALVPELYGADAAAELQTLKSQLESSGLFSVQLRTVSAARFAEGRAKGQFAAYQGGWSVDGRDPATYRSPYLVTDAELGNHYVNPTALALLAAPAAEADPARRDAALHLAQEQLATDLPVIPLVQHRQLAATATGVAGIRFDGSLTLRFGSLRMP